MWRCDVGRGGKRPRLTTYQNEGSTMRSAGQRRLPIGIQTFRKMREEPY